MLLNVMQDLGVQSLKNVWEKRYLDSSLRTRNESELIKKKNCKQLLWNFRAMALHGVAAVNWFQLKGG